MSEVTDISGEACSSTGGASHSGPVSWSLAFGWRCTDCRVNRTRTELGATEAANAKAALEARLAAGDAAGDK